ncbi:hypothetical protein HF326_04845 [Bacillus altitudinis MN12]|uniref:Uncharacterized protein n=3 Tax=Bacillus TaxID=1386 RepID=A0ABV1S7Y8_BACAB|nr:MULTISPECIES: hypothetical protein [Bacillus]KOA73510.1 hypothetical protein ACR53_17380 [Bacillus stratosphericus]MDH8709618.1 hypothetical protein [Micromonospora sp. 1209]QAR53469.1 hypothetical protein BAE_12020 [Bacillus aerophilus]CVM50644.1 Uncharacterised protein [Streptococcus pneumoniae]BAT47982.1 uncharacterized protein BTUAT1_08480 [Bacillus pumilus]
MRLFKNWRKKQHKQPITSETQEDSIPINFSTLPFGTDTIDDFLFNLDLTSKLIDPYKEADTNK